MTAAKDITVDAAAVVVLTQVHGISTWEEEQRTAPKASLCDTDVFTLLLTSFGNGLLNHRGEEASSCY